MAIDFPQTAFTAEPAVAFAGQIADLGSLSHDMTISRLLETVAGCDAGLFVVTGTDAETQCALPAAAADVTDKVLGVAVLKTMKEPDASGVLYQAKDCIPIARRCRIWVKVGPDGITPGDSELFVVHSGVDAGKVQSVAGAGPDATAIPNGAAKCLKVSGSIAQIDLNLP